MSQLIALPDDVLLQIFALMGHHALAQVAQVGHKFLTLAQEDALWTRILQCRLWPQYAQRTPPEGASMHHQFLLHAQIPVPACGFLLHDDFHRDHYGHGYVRRMPQEYPLVEEKDNRTAMRGKCVLIGPQCKPEADLTLQMWLYVNGSPGRLLSSHSEVEDFVLLVDHRANLVIDGLGEPEDPDGGVVARLTRHRWNHVLLVLRDGGTSIQVFVDGVRTFQDADVVVHQIDLGHLHFNVRQGFVSEIVGWDCAVSAGLVPALYHWGVPVPGAKRIVVGARDGMGARDGAATEQHAGWSQRRRLNRKAKLRQKLQQEAGDSGGAVSGASFGGQATRVADAVGPPAKRKRSSGERPGTAAH